MASTQAILEKNAGEYKDYTAQKTEEQSDAVAGRMAELKESAAAAARRAMDMFSGQTAGLDREAIGGGDTNEEIFGIDFVGKYGETEFKYGEMKLNKEAKQRAAADWEAAAERGIAARKHIYGAVGSVKEAIKDKPTYPTDIVQEARVSREYGGPKRGEKLVDDIGDPSGPASLPTVRTSD